MASAPQYPHDKDHSWQMVSILVQGILFEVPVHRLVFYSHEFSLTYSITAAAKAQKKHPPEDHQYAPVVLDVDVEDFRKFMKVIYPKYEPPRTSNGNLSLPKSEWLSVLKLTTWWKFNFFRKMAIECLTPQLETIEKIELGLEFYVSSWVVCGYREFIARPAHPTIEEGRKLGFEKVMTLWGIRDSHKAFGFPTVRTADNIIEEKIDLAFESELDELRSLEYPHLTPIEKRGATAAKEERERLRGEALLEEEQERERRLQDAARKKRRRTKERSVSMNSKQQEELLPSVRPAHSLPTRPMRRPAANHDPADVFRYPQPPGDHLCIPERPSHPPPLTPEPTHRFSNSLPSDEGTSSSHNPPPFPQQSPPCTPPRPIQAPAPLTPFFTPASSPPQPTSGNSVNDREIPQSYQPLLSLSKQALPRTWAWDPFRSNLPARPSLSMTLAIRSLEKSVFIWGSQEFYRLTMWYSSLSIGRWPPRNRLEYFAASILFLYLAHYLSSPRTFFSDEHHHLVFLRTAVILSGVVASGGFLAERDSSRVIYV